MATTENKLTKQKRVADVKRNIANEEKEVQRLMKQGEKRTYAKNARLSKGGSVQRKAYANGGSVRAARY